VFGRTYLNRYNKRHFPAAHCRENVKKHRRGPLAAAIGRLAMAHQWL
jgi:hypothetical protein